MDEAGYPSLLLLRYRCISCQEATAHHAVPSQEIRDDVSLDVVHQSSGALVVVPSVNQELFTGVLVDQRADLEPPKQVDKVR